MSSYSTLGTLVGSALLAVVALFIFCRGFLLTRTTYTATSTCHSTYVSAVSSLPNLDPLVPLHLEALFPVASSASSSCNGVPALVDSLSVIVVDALRFDFAAAALPLTIPSSVSSPAAAAAAAAAHPQDLHHQVSVRVVKRRCFMSSDSASCTFAPRF